MELKKTMARAPKDHGMDQVKFKYSRADCLNPSPLRESLSSNPSRVSILYKAAS